MRRAKDLIQGAMSSDKAHSVKKHLMLLALKSGMGGFEKVVGMVDGMVGVLEGEQVEDDKKDAWCIDELNIVAQEINATEVDLDQLRASIDEDRDSVAGVASEIEALHVGLAELDKSVAEA